MAQHRLLMCVALAAAVTLTIIAPAQASHHTVVYQGKLGHGGTIRIDAAGARTAVYFVVVCKVQGAVPDEEQEEGTTPAPVASLYEPVVAYEPLSGRVHTGRLSVDVHQEGQSHDEGSDAPATRIRLLARVTSHRVTGTFSLDQAQQRGPSKALESPAA